jgi:diguanylate cyclase (GGDEF)-like protein
MIERLRAEISSVPYEDNGKGSIHVSASVGITLLDPDVSVEESIDRADKALYLAKSGGRDRLVVWEASMV